MTALDRLVTDTPEPVLLAVLHRRVVELLELRDRLANGEALPVAARAMRINSEFRARTLAGQARHWTIDELAAALAGLVELDALVKGVPGTTAGRGPTPAGVHVVGRCPYRGATRGLGAGRQSAEDQACSWTTRSLSMAKTQRPSPRSSSSIRSGSMYSCEQSSHNPPGMPKHNRSLRSGNRNVVSKRVVMSR